MSTVEGKPIDMGATAGVKKCRTKCAIIILQCSGRYGYIYICKKCELLLNVFTALDDEYPIIISFYYLLIYLRPGYSGNSSLNSRVPTPGSRVCN